MKAVPESKIRRCDPFRGEPDWAEGRDCISRWSLLVPEAHFHRLGHFYEAPKLYPVAFCDPKGYVIRESVEDLLADNRFKVLQKVNVPSEYGNIASHDDYKRVDRSLWILGPLSEERLTWHTEEGRS